jgi:hypothetical protein
VIKKIIKITGSHASSDSKEFWMSKTPDERVEAVETIRSHYYSMLGFSDPPRIKKIIKIS